MKTPLTEDQIRALKVGDKVLLSGQIVTGRDRVHKHLFNERPNKGDIPFNLDGGALYHCGPVIRQMSGEYEFLAGGPTTSSRVEMYQADVIERYGIRAVIGKGGMGERTLEALAEHGCVYLHTISGAAVYLAERVKNVAGVWKLDEFGAAEAMWLLEVEDFPAIVTMDTHGGNLHGEIKRYSLEAMKGLLAAPV
jgi:fumarate hydratase class I